MLRRRYKQALESLVVTYLALELDLLVVAVRHVPLGQPRLTPEGVTQGQLVIALGRGRRLVRRRRVRAYWRFCMRMKDSILGALEQDGVGFAQDGPAWVRKGSTLEESCGSVRPGHFSVEGPPAGRPLASEAWRSPGQPLAGANGGWPNLTTGLVVTHILQHSVDRVRSYDDLGREWAILAHW